MMLHIKINLDTVPANKKYVLQYFLKCIINVIINASCQSKQRGLYGGQPIIFLITNTL